MIFIWICSQKYKLPNDVRIIYSKILQKPLFDQKNGFSQIVLYV